MELLTERHSEQIAGVISCYDRILIQGTLPGLCYAQGMTGYLYARKIRIFDYPRFAQPLRDQLRENAECLAAENGLTIEFIRRTKSFRKENKVREVLRQRGHQPGLVWIFSAMEPCASYQPWHDKQTGKTYLRPDDGKCLHYYFYFIDEDLGLCYVRVPTGCPFRLQVYLNGHHRLPRRLSRKGIDHTLLDNAFPQIGDFDRAQRIADEWPVERLHRKLDEFAMRYCPVIRQLEVLYHWSLDQVEFATDIVFHRQQNLQAIYGNLTRTAIHTVKPDNVATFLGRKLAAHYQDENGQPLQHPHRGNADQTHHGTGFDQDVRQVRADPAPRNHRQRGVLFPALPHGRTAGRYHRHQVGADEEEHLQPASVARSHAGGESALPGVPLHPRRSHCRRGSVAEGHRNPARENQRSYPGFNFFAAEDQKLFETLARGEFNLHGLQNKTVRRYLPEKTPSQISRLLKRLRLHGFLKKVARSYRYYLTHFGKQVIATGLKLKQLVLIPQLAALPSR